MNERTAVFLDLAVRRTAARHTEPRDCIRQFPTTNPLMVELVGFDSRSRVTIKVEVPRDENLVEWSSWLLRWVRRRERSELKAKLHIVD